jgi:hypothetical protein
MTSEDCFPLLRLRVIADADPTAIARVVERFTMKAAAANEPIPLPTK